MTNRFFSNNMPISIIKMIVGGVEITGAIITFYAMIMAFFSAQQKIEEMDGLFLLLFGGFAAIAEGLFVIALFILSIVLLLLGVCDLLCGIFTRLSNKHTAAMVLSVINESIIASGIMFLLLSVFDDVSNLSIKNINTWLMVCAVAFLVFNLFSALNVYAFIVNRNYRLHQYLS